MTSHKEDRQVHNHYLVATEGTNELYTEKVTEFRIKVLLSYSGVLPHHAVLAYINSMYKAEKVSHSLFRTLAQSHFDFEAWLYLTTPTLLSNFNPFPD